MIERIEVLRGPAAARYGNGAAGGVVNIITKRQQRMARLWDTYFNAPEHKDEGSTKRTNFSLNGPLGGISASVCTVISIKPRPTRGISTRVISQNVPARIQILYRPVVKG